MASVIPPPELAGFAGAFSHPRPAAWHGDDDCTSERQAEHEAAKGRRFEDTARSNAAASSGVLLLLVLTLTVLLLGWSPLEGAGAAAGTREEQLLERRGHLLRQLSALSSELRECEASLASLALNNGTLETAPLVLLSSDHTGSTTKDSATGDSTTAESQPKKDTSAQLLVTLAVCGVVFGSVLLSGCYAQERNHEDIPPRSVNEFDNPELWQNRNRFNDYVRESLKHEGRANFDCCALLLNRPWRSAPKAEIKGLTISSNKEWLANRKFLFHEMETPLGSSLLKRKATLLSRKDTNRQTRQMWFMIVSWWRFLWSKKQPWLCVVLMVVQGLCAPFQAQVFGWIVGDISKYVPDDNSDELASYHGRIKELATYCLILLILNLVNARAYYVYEVEVPGASVRHELIVRLHRQFIGMSPDSDAAIRWPPGRCSAMLNYDVVNAVNLSWVSMFELIQCVTTFLTLLALMLYNNRHTADVAIGSSIIFLALLTGAVLNGRLRRWNSLDMAKRMRDWEMAWTSLSAAQIAEARAGKLSEPDTATQELADAAMVYRKRAFQYFFVRLVSELVPSEMTLIAQALVAYIVGIYTMRKELPAGSAAALIAIVKLLADNLKKFTTIILNIQEGYASLLDIEEVFDSPLD
eukprot:TRINITY_DN18911_c0_g1_i1.p1 TRINITY_DN18911_c0_g1~~TRINITY_DN18911_c0_g1_i1.p1  ORF type:complete len:639 (-),score=119.21 TRINITY_DN18911_c0_g1_i1:183-2099(-)